jgi:hypothetical protein
LFLPRQSIKERLEEIEKGFFQFRVYREIKGTNDDTKRIRCLELNPAYVEEHRERWTLISLGEYLFSTASRIRSTKVPQEGT